MTAREIARHSPIERVIGERGVKLSGKIERVGPCPICGGRDRFCDKCPQAKMVLPALQ